VVEGFIGPSTTDAAEMGPRRLPIEPISWCIAACYTDERSGATARHDYPPRIAGVTFAGRVVGFPGALPPGRTGHITASAGELAAFVERVLSATGVAKVDVVGHSQGGMMPRYYLKFLGGAQKVHALVGLSPSNHGTTFDVVTNLLALLPGDPETGGLELVCGPSCEEQFVGSAFLVNLNAGGDTRPRRELHSDRDAL
jgi:pimeloyl-ACP methyl ester carboxylesterase